MDKTKKEEPVNLLPSPGLAYDIVKYNRFDSVWQTKFKMDDHFESVLQFESGILHPEFKAILTEMNLPPHAKYTFFMEMLICFHKHCPTWRYEVETIFRDMAIDALQVDWECWVRLVSQFASDLALFGGTPEEGYKLIVHRRRFFHSSISDMNNELRRILQLYMYFIHIHVSDEMFQIIGQYAAEGTIEDVMFVKAFKQGMRRYLCIKNFDECNTVIDVVKKLKESPETDIKSRINLHMFIAYWCAFHPSKCMAMISEYARQSASISAETRDWKFTRNTSIGDTLNTLNNLVEAHECRRMKKMSTIENCGFSSNRENGDYGTPIVVIPNQGPVIGITTYATPTETGNKRGPSDPLPIIPVEKAATKQRKKQSSIKSRS